MGYVEYVWVVLEDTSKVHFPVGRLLWNFVNCFASCPSTHPSKFMESPDDQGRVEGIVWAWFDDAPAEDESVRRQWMAAASQPHSGCPTEIHGGKYSSGRVSGTPSGCPSRGRADELTHERGLMVGWLLEEKN